MSDYIEFIPKAGACMVSKNVLNGAGIVRWMVRGESHHPADNGWQIISSIDDSDFLNDSDNWQIADWNEVCSIEPALIGIWDFPVGSDLELTRDAQGGIHIIDSKTGREIPRENFYVPERFRAEPGDAEASASAPSAPAMDVPGSDDEKPGFFGRLFGKK